MNYVCIIVHAQLFVINPRYFCRNVQYFSEFYINLSFSLFFLSFELLQSSRFWQNFFVVCKCL